MPHLARSMALPTSPHWPAELQIRDFYSFPWTPWKARVVLGTKSALSPYFWNGWICGTFHHQLCCLEARNGLPGFAFLCVGMCHRVSNWYITDAFPKMRIPVGVRRPAPPGHARDSHTLWMLLMIIDLANKPFFFLLPLC